MTTVRYYLSSVRCRFKCPIDELAALREDAAEIVTTGRRTRGKRVDYTKVAPIPGDDDDDDDKEEERPKKKAKKEDEDDEARRERKRLKKEKKAKETAAESL